MKRPRKIWPKCREILLRDLRILEATLQSRDLALQGLNNFDTCMNPHKDAESHPVSESKPTPLLLKYQSRDSDFDSSTEDIPFIKISPVKVRIEKTDSLGTQDSLKAREDNIFDSHNHSSHILAQIFSKNYSVERRGKNRLIFKDNGEEDPSSAPYVSSMEDIKNFDLSNQNQELRIESSESNRRSEIKRSDNISLLPKKACSRQPQTEKWQNIVKNLNHFTANSKESDKEMIELKFNSPSIEKSIKTDNESVEARNFKIQKDIQPEVYSSSLKLGSKEDLSGYIATPSEMSANNRSISPSK